MASSIKAGVAYFLIVFTVGFFLGTLRVLFLIPRVGTLPATLIEIPFMLATSWVVCGALVSRFRLSSDPLSRSTMGFVAFGLLMSAEAALAVSLTNKTIWDFLCDIATLPGTVGLASQLVFGLMPLFR